MYRACMAFDSVRVQKIDRLTSPDTANDDLSMRKLHCRLEPVEPHHWIELEMDPKKQLYNQSSPPDLWNIHSVFY